MSSVRGGGRGGRRGGGRGGRATELPVRASTRLRTVDGTAPPIPTAPSTTTAPSAAPLPDPAPSTTTAPSTSAGFPDALLENPTGIISTYLITSYICFCFIICSITSYICFVAGTIDENEVPPVTKTRKVRGPTRRSAETNRDRDAPRIRVTFSKGAPVSDMMNTFKTTVLGWIHSPLVLPQNVRRYDEIPFPVKEALFKRIDVSLYFSNS
jgi:hypothetical protein